MKTPPIGRLISGALGATVLITAALITPALTLAGNAPVTYQLTMGSDCVEGFGPSNASLHFVWRNSAGALKGSANLTTSEATGYWSHCSTDGRFVAVGDRLKATVGSYTRKFTVPRLTVNVDRVLENFHGTAPAGAPVTLWYVHGGCCADFEQHADLVADSNGAWSFSEGYPTDRYNGRIEWTGANGDFVQADDSAAAVEIILGKSTVNGDGDAHESFRVVLRDGQTNARKAVARGVANQYGSFSSVFRDDNGQPVNVNPGDRIDGRSLASDMKFLVKDIEASVDVAADTVDGRCLNSSVFIRLVVLRNGNAVGIANFEPDEDGTFSVWMGDDETLGYDPANIHRGDKVRVTCILVKGDSSTKNFVVR